MITLPFSPLTEGEILRRGEACDSDTGSTIRFGLGEGDPTMFLSQAVKRATEAEVWWEALIARQKGQRVRSSVRGSVTA